MRFKCLFLLILAVLAACSAPPSIDGSPTKLTVFAAASLTEAFTEIGQAFESENPGVSISFNFAGSQALRTQLEQGATADVFASANRKEIETAQASGLIDGDALQIFATNDLVVIVPAANPGQVRSAEDLARPGLKLVLAAEEVPVGGYARQVLHNLTADYGSAYPDQVLANVVSNEDNVKQVVTKVQLGEADAGIVYSSDAVAVSELATVAIPQKANVIAEYPLAILRNSAAPALAAEFVRFVLSRDGQAILARWGFASPGR